MINIKEQFKIICMNFFGLKYKNIIEERLDKLYRVIIYKTKENKKINTKEEYCNYYEIDDENISNGFIPISKYLLENNLQGMIPFLDKNSLKTIIYLPSNIKSNKECIVIHELLHALFEQLYFVDSNNVVTIGGFEKMTLKGATASDRNYEFLTETLHQRISEEMTEFAISNGINIFDDSTKNELNKYKSDRCEVIEQFYNFFRYELFDTFFNGSADIFIKKVGQEKFESLNNWIIDYYLKYPTIESRKTIDNKLLNKGLGIVENIISGVKII